MRRGHVGESPLTTLVVCALLASAGAVLWSGKILGQASSTRSCLRRA